jgi:hypothetical protein
MLIKLKTRLAGTRWIKRLLESPADLEIFKHKPSPKFVLGLFIIGFSYIIGWPMVSALGIVAVYFKNPLIFAIGSPVTYGLSHLVFMLGVFIAGKNTVVYMNAFLKWSAVKGLQRFLGKELIPQSSDKAHINSTKEKSLIKHSDK